MENREIITINGKRYWLKSFYFRTGPKYSIWNLQLNKLLSQGHVDIKATAVAEFTIETYDKSSRRLGLASRIMSLLIKWLSENNFKMLYGFLSNEDKENKNWEDSIPFY